MEGALGDDTSNRYHFMITGDQETMAQFLSKTVPTPVLSSTRVTVCLLKDAAHTPAWFGLLSVLSPDVIISTGPPNLPQCETKEGKSCVDKGHLDSPQHPVSRCMEVSVFIDSSWMPTERRTKPPLHPEVCIDVICWCPGPAACAFPSISLGKEDSVISKLKL